jgi:hypothetical protein
LVLAALLLLDSVGVRPVSARITVGDAVPVIKLSDWEGQRSQTAGLQCFDIEQRCDSVLFGAGV